MGCVTYTHKMLLVKHTGATSKGLENTTKVDTFDNHDTGQLHTPHHLSESASKSYPGLENLPVIFEQKHHPNLYQQRATKGAGKCFIGLMGIPSGL